MNPKIIYFTVLAIIGISMLIGGAIWKDITSKYTDTIGTTLIVVGSIVGGFGLVLSMIYVCLQ